LDTYLTIKQDSEGLYKEKGSRFIAFALSVESAEEIKVKLQFFHKEYHDARHICYAYVLGADAAEFRANDDGEPSGTAGKPIYGVLLSNKLTNVLIVVVRYFGGVKLGTSGLITAYREAAMDAINNVQIIEKTVELSYIVSFEYTLMNDIMRVLKEKGCEIIKQTFDNDCVIQFKIRKLNAKDMENRMMKIDKVKLTLIVEK